MRVLREVAARGSFSAAASALSFTQSAVSQHIAALEREAGTQLVERGARGIRLTEAGRALVAHADAILARLEDAEQELAAIAGLRGGRLRLGSFPSAGATLAPAAVARFHALHPQVDLSMVEAEPSDLLPRLRGGELDLALVYDYVDVGDDPQHDLERTHLLDDPVEVVLPRGHRLASRARVRLAELADEPWVSGTNPGSCHRMLMRACTQAGFEPRIAFQTDDCLTSQSLVAAGVGLSLLPELALSSVNPDVEIRSLEPRAPERRIFAVRLAEVYRSPASGAMLAILVEVAAEYRRAHGPAGDALAA